MALMDQSSAALGSTRVGEMYNDNRQHRAASKSTQSRMNLLELSVERFASVARRAHSQCEPDPLRHEVISVLHELMHRITDLELSGCSRSQIRQTIEPVRHAHGHSPLIKRMQDWPRGYQGDFETIELLVGGTVLSTHGGLAYHLERYILDCPAVQQHRNKVQHQAHIVKSAIRRNPESRILSVACGSCPDLRLITEELEGFGGQFVLNDLDQGALDFSQKRLEGVLSEEHVQCLQGNIIRLMRSAKQLGRFDLVIAGGLFDYLPDRVLVSLLRTIYRRCLRTSGELFFTNICRGNPFRPWMEYCGDWFLIERSEHEVREILKDAGIPNPEIDIRKDTTELTLLVSVHRG